MRRLAEALEESELEQHAVDPAAGEHEGDVAPAEVGRSHVAIVPPWSPSTVEAC